MISWIVADKRLFTVIVFPSPDAMICCSGSLFFAVQSYYNQLHERLGYFDHDSGLQCKNYRFWVVVTQVIILDAALLVGCEPVRNKDAASAGDGGG